MKQKEFAALFLKYALGFAMVICSLGFLFFSLRYNAAKAGSPAGSVRSPQADNYVPVGIEIKDNHVYLYGYDKDKLSYQQLAIIAEKTIHH